MASKVPAPGGVLREAAKDDASSEDASVRGTLFLCFASFTNLPELASDPQCFDPLTRSSSAVQFAFGLLWKLLIEPLRLGLWFLFMAFLHIAMHFGIMC